MAEFDLQDFLPYLLNQAAETTSREFAAYYRDRYGLLRTDWRVLFHLGRYGGMNAAAIAARAMIHKTKISRSVAKLTAKGFVAAAGDADDRRRVGLSLTARGRAAFDDLAERARGYDAALLRGLPPGEARALKAVLRRLAGPSGADGGRSDP